MPALKKRKLILTYCKKIETQGNHLPWHFEVLFGNNGSKRFQRGFFLNETAVYHPVDCTLASAKMCLKYDTGASFLFRLLLVTELFCSDEFHSYLVLEVSRITRHFKPQPAAQ